MNHFYAAASMAAKAIVRGELWAATIRDRDLKQELLSMIEWDHKARYGWAYDTWYDGKYLREVGRRRCPGRARELLGALRRRST